jgi:hypothetical protein
MPNNDNIINNLEIVYKRAIRSKTDRVFFQSIFDYIEAFDQEPQLVKVNKQIIKLSDQDLKYENDLEKKSQEEILKIHKETQQYLDTQEMGSRTVLDKMKGVIDAWSGELVSNLGKTRDMYNDLTYALMIIAKLDDMKHLKFCRRYGKIHDNGSVANWAKVSKTYPKWETECERNKRLMRFKVWHAWNEIAMFHNWFADYEVERDKLIKSRQFMELGYVSAKFKAIQAVITGEVLENKSVIEIKRDEYQRYLDMIHQHIKQQLNLNEVSTKIKSESCEYNSKSGLLTIKGKNLTFTPTKIRGLILGIFLKSKLSRKKDLYWEDITDEIGGADTGLKTSKQKRDQVLYAVIGINDRVLKKYQIPNFLSYNDGTVSLNSQFYL